MLVLMTCTMLVSAPIMMVGGVVMARPRGPRAVVAARRLRARAVPRRRPRRVAHGAGLPPDAGAHRRASTGCCASRSPASAWCGPSSGSPYETAALRRAPTPTSPTSRVTVGRWMATMFPAVMLILNVSSVAVLWFGGAPRRRRADAGRRAHGLPRLPRPDPHGRDDGDLHARHGAAGRRSAPTASRRCSTPPRRSCRRRDPVRDVAARGRARAARRRLHATPAPAEPVLRGISFVARPGQTTAVIGSTGAGKTHAASTSCRGCSTRPSGTRARRRRRRARPRPRRCCGAAIGLVPQRAYLFSGTVASNLRYGRPDATDDELWEALEVAQARDFVEAMPGGLDAPVAQGGTNVSGGQRQRLAIARALVRRPEVYLFDDAFSALDLATDARLRAALRPVTRDATVVVVAQRVSSIRDADQILVLDDGERRRPRHPRRAARRLPHLPGDRRVAAQSLQEVGMTAPVPARRRRQGDRADRRRRPGPGRGPFGGGMVGAEVADVRPVGPPAASRRLAPRAGPGRSRVLVLAVASVGLSVLGPRLLGRATDLVFTGLLGRRLPAGQPRSRPSRPPATAATTARRPARAHRRRPRRRRRLRRRRATSCCCALAVYVARLAAVLAAGLPAQRRRAAHGLAAARGGRGQAAPAAAALRRRAAARRAAQPGHQRHRQRQPDAAADAEPAADVAADGASASSP